MNKPIRIKLDRTKIDRSRFFVGKTGAEYYDFVAWPNRDGADQNGFTHYVTQSKKQGEDVKLPICGNLALPDVSDTEYRKTDKNETTGHAEAKAGASGLSHSNKNTSDSTEEDNIPF